MGNNLFINGYYTTANNSYQPKSEGINQEPPLTQLAPKYSTVKDVSGKEYNTMIIDFVNENGTKMKSIKYADFNNDGVFAVGEKDNELYEVNYYKNRVGDCRCEGVIIDRYTSHNGSVKKKVLEFDKDNNLLNKSITESNGLSLFDVKNGVTF